MLRALLLLTLGCGDKGDDEQPPQSAIEGWGEVVTGHMIFCQGGPGALAVVTLRSGQCDGSAEAIPDCESLDNLERLACDGQGTLTSEHYDHIQAWFSEVEGAGDFYDKGIATDARSWQCGGLDLVLDGDVEVTQDSGSTVTVEFDTATASGSVVLEACG